jgi:hypothetical protein
MFCIAGSVEDDLLWLQSNVVVKEHSAKREKMEVIHDACCPQS